jgi:hypothetical protein|tara:strand:- start:191 stop:472 length:282 start_codon:yes stop_codon:yes gene_type:complete
MWWILTILFFLISVVTSILTFYSLRRINQYEVLMSQFQQIISFSTQKMKLVDSKGHYESDDETSFFFNQLKELQILLDNIFENEEIKNAKKEK